jgi:hypothetical protein
LKAFIIEVRHPPAGFTITIDSFVRFTLLQKSDDNVLFDDVLRGEYTATVDDAFAGQERLRLAEEGAMRAVISEL